jgi:hypothetical protein
MTTVSEPARRVRRAWAAPLTGVLRRWDTLSGRARVLMCVALLFGSEIWQLARFWLLS